MQATLFPDCAPKAKRAYRRKPKPPTLEQRFEAFRKAHPEILSLLKAKALELKARGFKRYGIKALWEAMRYDLSVQAGEQPYKLDNSFTAPYARLLMQVEPRLQGFFETRGSR